VIQERVPVPVEDYPTWTPEEGLRITPRYVDSDPCMYGDHAIGCLTRIAATALLNVSAGGGAAPPTFVVTARVPSRWLARCCFDGAVLACGSVVLPL